MRSTDLITRLRGRIDDVLGPIVPAGMPVALVDFPHHPNVGDSATWLGEIAWLRKNRSPIRYVCDESSFEPAELRRRLGNGVVLCHGGGNFGDVWPARQQFRERLLTELIDLPIVQLPQTVSFSRREALQRAAEIARMHPRLTILTRDRISTRLVTEDLGVAAALCPDPAFCLTLRRRRRHPALHTIYLIRADMERRRAPQRTEVSIEDRTRDWPADSATFKRWARRALMSTIKHPRRLAHARLLLFNRLAHLRLRRGLAVLESGSRVVTDRLHAHILCVLLDIPHRLLDNSYSKNGSFVDAWTADFDGLDFDDMRVALKVAR